MSYVLTDCAIGSAVLPAGVIRNVYFVYFREREREREREEREKERKRERDRKRKRGGG